MTEQCQNQINELTDLMKSNLNRVIDRGSNVDDLVDRSENLNIEAGRFQVNSRQLQRKMCWQNHRNTLIGIVILILVITLILVLSLKH